jgi:hypothetical protein
MNPDHLRRRPARLRAAGARCLSLIAPFIVIAGCSVLLAALTMPPAAPKSAPESARWEPSAITAGFALRFRDETSRLRISSASVLPGETLDIQAVGRDGTARTDVVADSTAATLVGPGLWRWHAPATPGLHTLRLMSPFGPDSILLNIFVTVPRELLRGPSLNGYRIGSYPMPKVVQGTRLEPPAGFIEVTAENMDTPVSPHFRLGQFLCKEPGGFPKYIVLNDRLPLKLEALLEKAKAAGLRVSNFSLMSGYRTPYYNRLIGNRTTFSRHVWGAAADIAIEDYNGDGRINAKDTAILARLAEQLEADPSEGNFVGGLGRYASNERHGPFVHVDVRSRSARW